MPVCQGRLCVQLHQTWPFHLRGSLPHVNVYNIYMAKDFVCVKRARVDGREFFPGRARWGAPRRGVGKSRRRTPPGKYGQPIADRKGRQCSGTNRRYRCHPRACLHSDLFRVSRGSSVQRAPELADGWMVGTSPTTTTPVSVWILVYRSRFTRGFARSCPRWSDRRWGGAGRCSPVASRPCSPWGTTRGVAARGSRG